MEEIIVKFVNDIELLELNIIVLDRLMIDMVIKELEIFVLYIE